MAETDPPTFEVEGMEGLRAEPATRSEIRQMTESFLRSHPKIQIGTPVIEDPVDAQSGHQLQRILDAAKKLSDEKPFKRNKDALRLYDVVFNALVGLELTDEQMVKAIEQVSDAVLKAGFVSYNTFMREEMWAEITRAYIERRYGDRTYSPYQAQGAATLVRFVLSTIYRVLSR